MSERMLKAVEQLLESQSPATWGGFVIFQGEKEHDYVQFELQPNGLVLNLETFHEVGESKLDAFRDYLVSKKFYFLPIKENTRSGSDQLLKCLPKQFMILEDGLYAQVGKKAHKIVDLAIEVLESIYDVTDLESPEITLELAS